MKDLTEEVVILAGIVAGVLLFVIGLRQLKLKDTRSLWSTFLLAALFSIVAIPMLRGQQTGSKQGDKQMQTEQDQEKVGFEKRVEEIIKSSEWKKLRKIWSKLGKLLVQRKTLTAELQNWAAKVENEVMNYGKIQKQQDDNDSLLLKEDALKEMTLLTWEMALHLNMQFAECYKQTIQLPLQRSDVVKQLELLEKEAEAGKIKKSVYEKVKRAIEVYKYRGTVVAGGLNEKNMLLIFRLLREMSSPVEVDITQLSPELGKKIDELIERLGSDALEERQKATGALIEIGGIAIPKLKEALKHEDPEVQTRAKYILDELEEEE